MSTEHAKATAEAMATLWEGEFPATVQVLAAVNNSNRDYKPDAKSRSAWDLAVHLATADIWFADSIANGKFEWNPEAAKAAAAQFASVNDIVEFYKKTLPEKLKALRAMPAAQAGETLDFMGFMQMPRAQFIGFANNHSIHHRGQLTVYLRLNEARVPALYGPSADEQS